MRCPQSGIPLFWLDTAVGIASFVALAIGVFIAVKLGRDPESAKE